MTGGQKAEWQIHDCVRLPFRLPCSLHIRCEIHKHASALTHFPRDFARPSILSALFVNSSEHQPQSGSSAYQATITSTSRSPSVCPSPTPIAVMSPNADPFFGFDFETGDFAAEMERFDRRNIGLGSPAAASRMQGGEAE